TLRRDLYYRLNVVHFHIPPLRERKGDITLLTNHFIKKYNFKFHKLVTGIEEEMMQTLVNFSWPGNVRELEHAIESAMNLVEGDMLTKACFSEHIIKDDEADPLYSTLNLEEVMWQTERKF